MWYLHHQMIPEYDQRCLSNNRSTKSAEILIVTRPQSDLLSAIKNYFVCSFQFSEKMGIFQSALQKVQNVPQTLAVTAGSSKDFDQHDREPSLPSLHETKTV
jgi:hypothetical protein